MKSELLTTLLFSTLFLLFTTIPFSSGAALKRQPTTTTTTIITSKRLNTTTSTTTRSLKPIHRQSQIQIKEKSDNQNKGVQTKSTATTTTAGISLPSKGEKVPGGSDFRFCDSGKEHKDDVFEIREIGVTPKPQLDSIVFLNMSGTFHEDVPPESTINVTTIINGYRASATVDFCSFAQTVEQDSSSSSSKKRSDGNSLGDSGSATSTGSAASGSAVAGTEGEKQIHACPPRKGWGVIRRGDLIFGSPKGNLSLILDARVPDGRRLFCIMADVEME